MLGNSICKIPNLWVSRSSFFTRQFFRRPGRFFRKGPSLMTVIRYIFTFYRLLFVMYSVFQIGFSMCRRLVLKLVCEAKLLKSNEFDHLEREKTEKHTKSLLPSSLWMMLVKTLTFIAAKKQALTELDKI